jgi:hypothetical protein
MFPFTNALAYPNIGRRVMLGDDGTARSKAATTSGEVFFQAFTLARLYLNGPCPAEVSQLVEHWSDVKAAIGATAREFAADIRNSTLSEHHGVSDQ